MGDEILEADDDDDRVVNPLEGVVVMLWPGRQPTAEEQEAARRAWAHGYAELLATYMAKGVDYQTAERRAHAEQTRYSDQVWIDKMRKEGRSV